MNKTILAHLSSYKTTSYGSATAYEIPVSDVQHIVPFLYKQKSTQLKTMFAADLTEEKKGFRIYYVFGLPQENTFIVPYISLPDTTQFPSLTKYIHEVASYERKIHSLMGLTPVGHPDLRPFILHENWPTSVFPLRKNTSISKRPPIANGAYAFHTVHGEGIYEIPVGPVHAGIIEPGHFRFSVAGEEIMLLEPKLGYKHRGVEKLFETLPLAETVRLAERVSGDTSFSHSLAYCQAIETLAGVTVSKRTALLRVIFSELERLANHINDIGFIMLDTGYSFGGSSGQRLRETVMQWNERLTGSRYLRGVNIIGGATKDISTDTQTALITFLSSLENDFREVLAVSSESSSLYNRLEGTGTLDKTVARDHGVIGVAGRALGLPHDARKDYPYAAYDTLPFPISLQTSGDVRARFGVRVKEVYTSLTLLRGALSKLKHIHNAITQTIGSLKKNSIGIGVTEGWRGDIIYTVFTDANGNITRVDVRDPSFLIWSAVGHAGKGNVVPDFPLINKSFNLSYSGHDL